MKSQKNKSEIKKSSHKSTSESLREISPYLNIGWFFLAAILMLAGIGYLADNHWGTHPWGKVIGAVLGIIVGFYNFFKTVSNSSGSGTNQ